MEYLNHIEDDFISKIQFDNLNRINFYNFYNSYFEAIIQHDVAMIIGGTVNASTERIKRFYDETSILDSKIK